MKKRSLILLLVLTLCAGLLPMAVNAAAPAASEETYQYTFVYNDTTYTISTCEWEEGSPMPTLHPGSGGMRGTDDETVFEFVVGISTSSGNDTVPADADIFKMVTGISYTLEGKYLEGSVSTVQASGTGYSVTRDTMLGTGSSVTTMGFQVTVPAKTYINMDAIVTITLQLDETETTLTQRFNIQKLPSNPLDDRTLPLPADMGTEELSSILKDRASIWAYYQKFYQCDNATLQKAMQQHPLWIYLPAGSFGSLSADLQTGGFTIGEESFTSYSAISIVGADSGTTFTSLNYTPDDTGMSNIVNVRFNMAAQESAENTGLTISSGEENWGGSVGVSGCTFTGYDTAISVEGYAAAGITNCTFTKNTTAVSLNGKKTKYDGFASSVGSCIFRQNGTGVLLKSLGNGTAYSFRVTGCDFIGNDLDVNYQVAGRFYLLDNYYASLENGVATLKKMATVMGSYSGTAIVQGIWRTASTQSATVSYGISDGGVVLNDSKETLDAAYLDEVSFNVISTDDTGEETLVGTWTFK